MHPVHQRDAQGLCTFLQDQANGQAVEGVHDDFCPLQELGQVLAGEPHGVAGHFHGLVDLGDAPLRRLHLVQAQAGLAAQELAVEVVLLEHVAVYQDQPAHAHAGQRLGDVPAQSAQAHDGHGRPQQPSLPLQANCAQGIRLQAPGGLPLDLGRPYDLMCKPFLEMFDDLWAQLSLRSHLFSLSHHGLSLLERGLAQTLQQCRICCALLNCLRRRCGAHCVSQRNLTCESIDDVLVE